MSARIRRRGRHARRYTTLRMTGGAVLLVLLAAAVFLTGAIAQPMPSQASSRPPVPYVSTRANLTRELLTVFYERGEARSLLLAFYRWQQPGLARDIIAPYVRSLIIDYPRAMRSCLIALHNRRPYASLGRTCP